MSHGQAKLTSRERVRRVLSNLDLVSDLSSPLERDSRRAIALATWLLERSQALRTPDELEDQAAMDRLIRHPEDKATLVELTDQAFRAHDPGRIADQLAHVLQQRGIPHSFGTIDRALLATFRALGPLVPAVTVPLVLSKMRQEAEGKVLRAEEHALRDYLRRRHQEGVRINLNFLGEAVLSESEAEHRLDHYLAALTLPEVECISAKISTLYSQVSLLAHEKTQRILGERLTQLLLTAQQHPYIRPDGKKVPKFIYLDMEEYRDMHMTIQVLKHTLDQPGLESVAVGVAIQAYLPDAASVLEDLCRWATRRSEKGGSPLTIRLVKGANMEMERVEAALEGWPQAPFDSKLQTDANWKRILRRLLEPQFKNSIRIGVASHNLFDLALAIVWADDFDAYERVQFEMLEGMADHQRRAVGELVDDLLLYAPACREEEFVSAIGYLIRRLDENTVAENFLRHAFVMQPGGSVWQQQSLSFQRALQLSELPPQPARRNQNRQTETIAPPIPVRADHWSRYLNEPNTDWSLPQNIRWIEETLATWKAKSDADAVRVPLVINDQERFENGTVNKRLDPSRPGVTVCVHPLANESDIQAAVACAANDRAGWRQRANHDREDILRRVAQQLRRRRGDLMAAAMACGGKTLLESDPEVSEAIDFVEFYALVAAELYGRRSLSVRPRGVVAVISPWNFPIAIPCGGIAAALASGNCVLLKPATDTVLAAYVLCQCFWDAGVPREALQFLPCDGSIAGQHLITNPQVDSVILTGGTETALRMLQQRPDLDLWAETGGKNATIVTRLADRDLAIKHVLHSAFSHGGQKCSATSLLLLERPLFEDKRFRQSLVDAASSLAVGSSWDAASKIGPLIRPPSGALKRGLTRLETDELWALASQPHQDNPQLWSPGIKWNVSPGNFTHLTELFGPVLGVMPFDDLDEAIELVHATGYGLTSGLHSLDDREQERWTSKLHAGNLYLNRPTTGAIVLRQPFGGFGRSGFGAGIKAGGPNYLIPLVSISDAKANHETAKTDTSIDFERLVNDFRLSYQQEFGASKDFVQLLGQDNLHRYLPLASVLIRLTPNDTLSDTLKAIAAAQVMRINEISLSVAPDVPSEFLQQLAIYQPYFEQVSWSVEPEEQVVQWIADGQIKRVRYLQPAHVETLIRRACHEHWVGLVDRQPVSDGRVELVWYCEEQSISRDYHRYGNLGRRAGELRRTSAQA